MSNALAKQNQGKVSFAAYVKSDAVVASISSTLGDAARSQKFVASIISAVSTNPALRECDSNSIISSALLGESLNLSPSPQLGHYYLVPFNNKDTGKVATFQLGLTL